MNGVHVIATLVRHDGRRFEERQLRELASAVRVDVLDPRHRLMAMGCFVQKEPWESVTHPEVREAVFRLSIGWREAQAQLAVGRRRFVFREVYEAPTSFWLDGLDADGRPCSLEAQKRLDEAKVHALYGKSRQDVLREHLAEVLYGDRWPGSATR